MVVFLGEGRRRLAEHHVRGELLLDAESSEDETIHVAAGGFLALRAQPFGARARLAGRVTTADDCPVPRAPVTVEPLGRDEAEGFTARARAEADGRFELELADARPGETLRVRATDGSPYRSGSGDNQGVTDVVVTGDTLRADVVLAPALSITGSIRDPAGNPLGGWLEARPEPPAPAGAQVVSDSMQEGRFELGGLVAGNYELVLHRPLEIASVLHRFPGIQAGARDLELVGDIPLDLCLAVRFEAPRPVGSYRLLLAMPLERGATSRTDRAEASSWPAAAGPSRVASVGWPEGACIGCTGSMPVRVARADLYSYIHRGRGRGAAFPHRFEGLPAGDYVVGVDAEDDQGRPFAPLLAAPARYDGEHELTFVLTPSASVTGRVLDLDASVELLLEVRDPSGARLPLLDATSRTVLSRPISADGRFDLEWLPAGEVILRLGTAHDLERGGRVVEQPLTLAADESTSVELVWR